MHVRIPASVVLLCLCPVLAVSAQSEGTSEGGIEVVEVEVVAGPELDSDQAAPQPQPPPPDGPTAAGGPPKDQPAHTSAPPTAGELDPAATSKAPEEPSDAFMEVTVAGTRVARTAGSAHVVKPEQLERFEYDDPTASLMQVPGVVVRQEDGLGLRPNISLRGANPDRSKKVTLMEDGILFGPAPYSAPAAYYFPIFTRMAHMRVIKGPSAVAYGPQTVGGAIDMATRAIPTSADGAVDLGVGMFGYQKAHAHFGTSDVRTGFLVEGVRLHTDGFKELDGGGNTGFTRNEWMVKANHTLDPSAQATHTFQLKLGYSDEVSNETYLGLTDADFGQNPDRRYRASALDRMDNHRTQLVLTHVFDLADEDLQVKTSVYRHDFRRAWRKLNGFRGASAAAVLADPETPLHAELYDVLTGASDSATGADTLLVGPNDRAFISQGVQSLLSAGARTGPIGHRVEAGLRLHYDEIIRRHSQAGYQMLDGALFPDGMATETTTANQGSTLALSAHVIDALTWGDLDLSPGLRLEVIASELRDELAGSTSEASTIALLPGLGAFYELFDGFGLLAGVYRGFSPPPPGADDVEPEYSINYEAGGRLSVGRGRAELIGFFNDYQNLTNLCTFSTGCLDTDLDSQSDAGSAHIYGFEAYVEHAPRLGSVAFPFSAAYTYTRAVFRDTFTSSDPIFGAVRAGDQVPYVPRHQANVTVAVEHDQGRIAMGVTYVAAMREQAGRAPLDDSVVTDALWTADLSGSLPLFEGVELYANLRNAFDQRAIVGRRPYGARPNAPRWFQVGIKGGY